MLWSQPKLESRPINTGASADLEVRTQQIGRELLAATRAVGKAGALSAKFWSDKLMAAALADERFKVELFRFVDVFPVLKTPEQVHRHLVEYLEQPGVKLPAGMGVAIKAGGVLKGMFSRTVASQIEGMAANFIAGRDVADALPAMEERWREGIGFSVDVLGEACVSQAEAEAYGRRYAELVEKLPAAVAGWKENAVLERDHLGAVPRVNVSVKVSALDGHVSPVDMEGSVERLAVALGPLLTLAGRHNVLINFDMEQAALKELTIRLFKRCCGQWDFPAGLALQAYLRSADDDARDLVEWAKASGRVVTVRLIKGAYWDYETIHAEMMNWPQPVWARKHETDACFERVTKYLLDHMPRRAGEGGVKAALGTHNVRSVAWGMACLESAGLPKEAIEFQALRGMAEELKSVLAQREWRVREYMPVGEMIPGMAYLVRRLLENTSNEGWLRAGNAGGAEDAELLASPHEGERAETGEQETGVDAKTENRKPNFANEPLRDFSRAEVRAAFGAALAAAKVAAVANDGTVGDAGAAVARAREAFPAWRDLGAARRAGILQKAAAILRDRRDALSGIIVLESGKTWGEADGDVCEAIDFFAYYAREALRLFTPERLGRFAGESNEAFHEPRGVAAVIAPWNFPLSICTGMTVAALVTGNTVVLKPAEQTPGIARTLCEALWAAGVPLEALQFLPGAGEVVGAALVRDTRVSVIAFTGSKDVGLGIVRAAAETPPEQTWVKRVICEMGGKNAIIVDASADLDEAVLGVRQSAFGFAGQKCSAGSRVIVLESVHDAFVARLVESAKTLVVGDPVLPGVDIGPVIDDEAGAKIRQYIEIGRGEGTLAYASPVTGSVRGKPLIGPHIFTDVQGGTAGHRIAREEIFGPVLAVLKARDFSHALELANDSVYKLTGGLFSRTPSHLARARSEFRVGNLYLNRGVTGALVGRQPFGGFGLSGVGAKAGGPHYLLQFTDPRVVTENTLRRGFAPESAGGTDEPHGKHNGS